jgi:hypothetical protein
MTAKKLNRALSVDDFSRMKFRDFNWSDEWADFFGDTELAGVWIAWADSGNGKTSFALQLCKYLCSHGIRCVYNSLEQGRSKSLQKQILETNFGTAARRFQALNREPIEDLKIRLRKKQSAQLVVIDSLQYTQMKFSDYKALKEEFPNKLFLFISHAKGKEPKGAVADAVRYDADVKIYIEGYRAFCLSRLGGGAHYDIWPSAAAKYYNEDL